MNFAWPWLFAALPLPWLLRALLPPVAEGAALRVSRLPPARSARSIGLAPARHLLAGLAWTVLVMAAARPQLAAEAAPRATGRAMMLAFDISESMATTDLRRGGQSVERLQAARVLAAEFLARRTGDRVGLVVFGAQAYLHTPPTADIAAVRAALDSVQAGLAGRETALGDAIALSVKYLKDQPVSQRMLVVLTDGAQTAGTLTPSRAAWLAQREGVNVHAVAVGAAAEADQAELRRIAAQTGGRHAQAIDEAGVAAFFASLDAVAAAPGAARAMRDVYVWPLALACLLAAAAGWRWPEHHGS